MQVDESEEQRCARYEQALLLISGIASPRLAPRIARLVLEGDTGEDAARKVDLLVSGARAPLLNFRVTYAGGRGPDAWDSKFVEPAVDIQAALDSAVPKVDGSGGVILSIEQL